MKLEYREQITYVIYTEDYSNEGLTREQLIKAAESIHGVMYVEPYGINDELLVSLFTYCSIDLFLLRFEIALNRLLK